ncbi:unnamed protein product [Schistocephalus solidus]|uniref:Zinc finger protein 106 n=1 Tax=Schistocephalus solidus TaxID=70667 RepID=A0A183TFG8_SCHSO|nr:unnamed protein product [Schistocephalus solidus]
MMEASREFQEFFLFARLGGHSKNLAEEIVVANHAFPDGEPPLWKICTPCRVRNVTAEKPPDDHPARSHGIDLPALTLDKNSLGGGGNDKNVSQPGRKVLNEKSLTDNMESNLADSSVSPHADASLESPGLDRESTATHDNRTRWYRKRPYHWQSSHRLGHRGRFGPVEDRSGQDRHSHSRSGHPRQRYYSDPRVRSAGWQLLHPSGHGHDFEGPQSRPHDRHRGVRTSQRPKPIPQGHFGGDIALSNSTTFTRMHEVWEISEALEKLKQQQATLELYICRLNAALDQTKKEKIKLKERRSAILKDLALFSSEMDQSDSPAESEPDSPARVAENGDPPGPSELPSGPLSDTQPLRRCLLPTPPPDLTAFTPPVTSQDLGDPSTVVNVSRSPSLTQDPTTVAVRASEVQICDGTDASGEAILVRPIVLQTSAQSTATTTFLPSNSPPSADDPLRSPTVSKLPALVVFGCSECTDRFQKQKLILENFNTVNVKINRSMIPEHLFISVIDEQVHACLDKDSTAIDAKTSRIPASISVLFIRVFCLKKVVS